MFPIPERFVPEWLRRKRALRVSIFLLLCGVFAVLVVQEALNLRRKLNEGPRFYELHKKIAQELMDSSAIGIERYFVYNGHYPSVTGKYFLDSIKQLVSLEALEVYIYADTVSSRGEVKPILGKGGNPFPFRSLSRTYFGVGHWKSTIVYRPLERDTYLLYWTGDNGIDEAGGGDDLVFSGHPVSARR